MVPIAVGPEVSTCVGVTAFVYTVIMSSTTTSTTAASSMVDFVVPITLTITTMFPFSAVSAVSTVSAAPLVTSALFESLNAGLHDLFVHHHIHE